MTIPTWLENDIKPIGGYLFGSRSMVDRKSANPDFNAKTMIGPNIAYDTDYDIAAPFEESVEKYLTDRGYTCVDASNMYAKDKYFKTLYTKKGHDNKNAQIILRSNHELFKKVWNTIDPEFYYENIWKRSPEFMKKYRHLDHVKTKEKIMLVMNQLYNTAEKFYGI